MSFKYGSGLYQTPSAASRAAIEDFLFAGGNNSVADVAQMDAYETAAEMLEEGWQIPFLCEHGASVIDLAQEVIDSAREAFVAEADAEELDEIIARTEYTRGACPIGGGARADAEIYNVARAELAKRNA